MISFSELREGEYKFDYPSQELYGGQILSNPTYREGCGFVVDSITKGTFTLRWTLSGKNRPTMHLGQFNKMFPNYRRES